jgi:hypothetical protein
LNPSYDIKDYTFKGKFYTVTEFVRALQYFFHKFGFLYQSLGIPNNVGDIPIAVLPADRPAYRQNFAKEMKAQDGATEVGWGARDDEANLVTVSTDSDSRLKFILTPKFADNFFIEVSENMQKALGLPPQIFKFEIDPADLGPGEANPFTQSTADHTLLDPADNTSFDILSGVDLVIESTTSHAELTQFSLRALDTRLSVDVTCIGVPISNKITSISGKEEHEHILARFWLSDFKSLETRNKLTDEGFHSVLKLAEKSVLGLEDLTRGRLGGGETNYLKPASIQYIRVKLETRYMEDGVVITQPTKMNAGFWTLKLVFIKKT